MVGVIWGLLGALCAGAAGGVGYCLGRWSTDADEMAAADATEDMLQDAVRETEARCDELHAGDWEAGYAVGLDAGKTAIDPATLTTTATAVRDARLKWIHAQTVDHRESYRDLFWRMLEVARDVGERYRKAELSGTGGIVPIGDALNVCVYVADIAKHYDNNKILNLPHRGVYQGKAS